MTALLTLVAWVPISFLSAWLWGTAFSRGAEPWECELAAAPKAPGVIRSGYPIVVPWHPIEPAALNVTAIEPRCELRCHPGRRSLSPMECEVRV